MRFIKNKNLKPSKRSSKKTLPKTMKNIPQNIIQVCSNLIEPVFVVL